MMNSYLSELDIAQEAAQRGADVLREHFGALRHIQEKAGDKGLVTEADTAAEKAILDTLRARSPHAILSEESGQIGSMQALRWIVDPLDGTTNFARSLPWFAVSVALFDGKDVLVGVVIDPIQGDIYAATRGGGATLNGAPLRIPSTQQEQKPALFLNHGYDAEDRQRFAEVVRRLSPEASLRMLGPTALELCHLAHGSVDGFACSGDEFWDFAAGMLIAQEAGCVVSDWQGTPWTAPCSYLVVAKPWYHATLCQTLRDLQSDPPAPSAP